MVSIGRLPEKERRKARRQLSSRDRYKKTQRGKPVTMKDNDEAFQEED